MFKSLSGPVSYGRCSYRNNTYPIAIASRDHSYPVQMQVSNSITCCFSRFIETRHCAALILFKPLYWLGLTPSCMYRSTGNYWISLILNHHNLKIHLAICRSFDLNEQLQCCGLSTERLTNFFQNFHWTTNGSSGASSAPAAMLLFSK